MSRYLLTILLTLAVLQALPGCGHSAPPTAPSPGPTPTTTPQPPPVVKPQVMGYVFDTTFQPLRGVRIEVLDGPDAGTAVESRADGGFQLDITFDETTRFRATGEAYLEATATLPSCPTCNPARRYISFYLSVPASPVNVSGEYLLTLVADGSCSGIPEDVRTRTFAATVTPEAASWAQPNTYFRATLRESTFFPKYNVFGVGVAGDRAAFELRWDGPAIVEEVAPHAYMAFNGRAEARIAPGQITLSVPFEGTIEYCGLPSPISQSYYDCRPGAGVTRAACESSNHRLILVRR